MPQGTLAYYKPEKAYGFIRPDDGTRDVFVHLESFPTGVHPEEGLRLEYDVETDQRSGRLRATGVKVAGVVGETPVQ